MFEHRRDIRSIIWMHGYTDARCTVEIQAVLTDWRLERRTERLGHAHGSVIVLRDAQQRHEFVATKARDRHVRKHQSSWLQSLLQPARRGTQHLIADRVPQGVIHSLEVVQIQVEYRDLLAGESRVGKQGLGGI